MQFGTVLRMMAELARLKGEDAGCFENLYESQKTLINSVGWDGEWFRRCIADDGRFIGSASEPQAKIWLNTQSWSVISGMGGQDKQVRAMDAVKQYLDTDLGIKKIHPSMRDYPSAADPLTHYNKGCGENGSVFCHANTWAVIAECMLGRAENAWKYYRQLLPMVVQAKAGEWRYKAEPYVYASNIFGPESDKFGLANVSWLTGTAAWMYIAATQYLLGVKARWDGLEISPCLPDTWRGVKITREFRGCRYDITLSGNSRGFIPHVEGRKNKEITIA
jgi:cellobiose phosphorylase